MQRIVTIGGGTGHFQLLRGLKNYDCDITAIVSTSDDGGSSGKLRDTYGILPPGDLRQCMVALAPDDDSMVLRKLFAYRFSDGHNLGNLIITAAGSIAGGEMEGIRIASKLLNIQGIVVPVTLDHCTLMAETTHGKTIQGEKNIDVIQGKETRIQKVWLEPRAHLFKEAAQAIRAADKIVFCPGDLYGSTIPNLLVQGMSDVLKESRGKKIYACNLFTKQGCYGFNASDFVNEIEKYSKIKLDHILINTFRPSQELIGKYLLENSNLVEDNMPRDPRAIRNDFAQVYPSTPNPILRHIPEKVAKAIIEI